MKYYRYLYVGDKIKNADKYKLRLKTHKALAGFYVLALADEGNQLDIIAAYNLKLKYYRKKPPIVIGIAKNMDEAKELVIKMTKEALIHTGSPDIKEYLSLRAKTKDFTVG